MLTYPELMAQVRNTWAEVDQLTGDHLCWIEGLEGAMYDAAFSATCASDLDSAKDSAARLLTLHRYLKQELGQLRDSIDMLTENYKRHREAVDGLNLPDPVILWKHSATGETIGANLKHMQALHEADEARRLAKAEKERSRAATKTTTMPKASKRRGA